ncbi:hypothetical protein V1478_009710 [Vespula squamosa]|uniref:Uncharacterized protein n=1 Tax=Vespula squamosa TaxID=30214 RepID=A0ABD2AQE5_VESSQ
MNTKLTFLVSVDAQICLESGQHPDPPQRANTMHKKGYLDRQHHGVLLKFSNSQSKTHLNLKEDMINA